MAPMAGGRGHGAGGASVSLATQVLLFVCVFCVLSVWQAMSSTSVRMFYVGVGESVVGAGGAVDAVDADRRIELQIMSIGGGDSERRAGAEGGGDGSLANTVHTEAFRSVQIISPFKCWFVDEYDNVIGSHSQIDGHRFTAVLHQPFSVQKSYFFIVQLQDSATSTSVIKERVVIRSVWSVFAINMAWSVGAVAAAWALRGVARAMVGAGVGMGTGVGTGACSSVKEVENAYHALSVGGMEQRRYGASEYVVGRQFGVLRDRDDNAC
jgi:hypothetical protein